MTFDQILHTDLWNGTSLADLLTLEAMASVLGSVLTALLILFAGFLVSAWVGRRIEALGRSNRKLDATLFDFLGSVTRYTILGFSVLFVLNTFGIQTTSLVAAIGAAGLAIGLALQGTLSNVAAGVMIVLFRPIRNGDFVEVAGVSGTVKYISLNFTELATAANVQVIVPNAKVWGNVITNYSIYATRRAEWSFGVGYGANLKRAEEIIREAITSDPRALADPAPFIQVNNLGESSVDFLVRVWVASGDYFAFQTDMTRKVKEALDEGGIDIPFPTRTLVMQGGAPEVAAAE